MRSSASPMRSRRAPPPPRSGWRVALPALFAALAGVFPAALLGAVAGAPALGCGGGTPAGAAPPVAAPARGAAAPRAAASPDAEEPPLPPLPWDDPPAPEAEPRTPLVVLRGGVVLTGTGREIRDGTVILENGKIRAVGPSAEIAVPEGAEVVELRGRTVTPGLIDTHSHMGVYAAPSLRATQDGNEATAPVTADVDAADSFWPQDPALARALAAGVTTIQVLPGSANLIGGRGAVLKLHLGRSAEEMRFSGAPPTLKIACGENPKRVYGERRSAPSTRMGNVAGYRRAFQQAVEYGRAWRTWQLQQRAWQRRRLRYDAARASASTDAGAGSPGGANGSAAAPPDAGTPADAGAEAAPEDPGPPPAPPARDRGLETLLGAIEGRVLVQNHCYRADEMLRMIALGREFGFRIRSFHHAVEAYKIRDVLAREGISVSTWADWWGFKLEAFDAIEQNLALLELEGVRAIVHSDDAMLVQRLAQEAAKAMRAAEDVGLRVTEAQAIAWITANPAWALGVHERTGTLEVGKMADVVVWSASPFSVYAHADRVYVDGRLAFDREAPDPFAGTDFEVGLESGWVASRARGAADLAAARAGAPPSEGGPAAPREPTTAVSGAADEAARAALLAAADPDVAPVALRGARLLRGDGTAIEAGTIVLRGGTIAAIGAAAPIPAGATVIDAAGLTVTPGLVAVGLPLGLVEIDAEPSAADAAPEGAVTDAIRAAFAAADGYNPASALVPVARLGGVAHALATPQGGLVAGTSAFVDLRGETPDEAIARPRVALHVDVDDDGVAAAGGARPVALTRLREVLDDARLYARSRAAFDRRALREMRVSRLDLERLADALTGRLPVVVRVARADDILRVLALGREYRLRLVLAGVEEGWKVAPALAAARVPCIVTPLENLPERLSRLGARLDNAALLARAGVPLVLTTDGAHGARTLRQQAGNAVAHGLDPHVALRAITSEPARVFGAGDDVGILRPGRAASVAVWSGDPLELRTRLLALFVRGRPMPLRSRQTALFERYRDLAGVRRGRPASPGR
jgi:imidazolonepropionase-like amidohydrolase